MLSKIDLKDKDLSSATFEKCDLINSSSNYVEEILNVENDNEEVIEMMNPISRFVYYLGDVNCHQLSHRSYEYNGNQMSFCARDFGIFLGLAMGFTYSLGRRIELTLPLIILALTPIGIDGTIQLLTDYESTNPRRIITGLIAGVATGIALKIIADSLDKR